MKIMTITLNPCVDRTLWVREFGEQPIRTEAISGGKGVNVARVLTALGDECLALAPAGGETGEEFARLARAEGVKLTVVPIGENTRQIDTWAREGDCAQRVRRDPSPAMTGDEIEALKKAALDALSGCAVLAVCGSACCREAAALGNQLITAARSMGVKTLLDSNGEALEEGVKARPDVLKVNEKELEQLLGPSDDPLHGEASRLTEEGRAGRVLVTLGERGCAQYMDGQAAFCPSPKVAAVNPVGSGDCFTAAWLHAQIHGFSDDGALALACAAGAANAARFPAARITLADLEEAVGFRWLR